MEKVQSLRHPSLMELKILAHYYMHFYLYLCRYIGPEVEVILRGDKPMVIQTVAGGDIVIGSDFILDGKNASIDDGYGGIGVLNPWSGRSSEALPGYGPGGSMSTDFGGGTEQLITTIPMARLLCLEAVVRAGVHSRVLVLEEVLYKYMQTATSFRSKWCLNFCFPGGNGRFDEDSSKPGGGGSAGQSKSLQITFITKG